MSSIFSDPFFRRGSTLLGGEDIEIDANTGTPVAGREVIGQVKAFQDVNPVGRGERYSNRLVYCVAARYTGSTVTDASTVAGKAYVFSDSAPLSEFSALATNADAAAGKFIGVLDEYLTGVLRQNDVVWIVVKGPTAIQKASNASVAAGGQVELGSGGTAGQALPLNTGAPVAISIAGAAVTGAQGTLLRVNERADFI